jgi:hypothetical protein
MIAYFLEISDHEFRDAILWYDQQLHGLGDRFGSAVKETVFRIQSFPEASTVDADGFRRVYVKGFPYKLIYKIVDDQIWIVAVAHGHRMPEFWKDRI